MTLAPASIEACCATLYGHPLVELVAGQSFHPGGLAGTRRLLAVARLPAGARMLDAGCGLGASAQLAALEFGLAVDACDVSNAAIKRARTLAAGAGAVIRFVEASIQGLPFEDGRFAGVLAECVLSTNSKASALAELRRVMAPGGVLLVTDVTATDGLATPELLAAALCLTGAWQPGELEDLVASSGFEIVEATDETASVTALIDRIEARLGLLTLLSRELAGAGFFATAGSAPDAATMAGTIGDARRLVAEGRIGYRAVVARAIA